MHSNDSNYQDGYQARRSPAQRHASEQQPLEHELYPDVTARQDPYGGSSSYQSYQPHGYDQAYDQPDGQRYDTRRQATRPRYGQASPNRTTRQTAADLGQVDNSQVAGRVAYDQDGNLVVVKKEEKAPVQMAAIVGSALSAVTSALFSSHIGIGGSLLTVAIGAAVSAAGTQLYTHIIKKSTDKIKSVVDNGPGSQQITGVMDSSQLDSDGYGYETQQTFYDFESEEGVTTADGSRIAPQSMIDAASEEHERQVKRRGIIVVAIAALVAVIVAAGVVTWATQGNGLGAKTPPIVSSVATNANENATNANTTPEAPAATANANATQDTGTQTSTATNASAGGTSSSAASQNAGSATAGTSTSGTSTGSTSGTGASGSGAGATTNTTGTGASGSSATSGSNGSASANTSGTNAEGTGGNTGGSSTAANASSGTGSSTSGASSTTTQAGTSSAAE